MYGLGNRLWHTDASFQEPPGRYWVGDLVIWDNRATMHRGRPFDEARYRRELRRVTTLDLVQEPDAERPENPLSL
jgi:TfdA family taurine catabolism dioxygenase TauD